MTQTAGDAVPAESVAAPPPESAADVRRRKLVFLVVCAGFVMSSLDMMIVNVAFPALEADFSGSTAAGLSWTLNAYSIVFAAALVPAGRLSDRSSRKGGFLLGLGLFTLASAACAASQGVPMLVAARVLQAVGAAAMVPTSLGLLLATYPAERRGGAVRAWTAVGGVAAALAPIVGGALVNLDWRWIFLINLPFGIVALLVGRRVLPTATQSERGPLPDLLGSLLIVLAVGAASLALIKAPEWGWGSARVLGSFALTVVCLAEFFRRSARHPNPVVAFSLLRVRSFSLANLTALVFNSCFGAMLFSFMLWCQNVWGYSALETGLALAPGTFLMPVMAMSTGRLVKRFGAATVVVIGCALLAAGVLWWGIAAQSEPDYVTMLLPGALLTPVGTILGTTALVGLVTKDLPPASFATGSAVNMMVRQVGLVIGISVFIAVLGTPGAGSATVDAFRHAWFIAAGIGILALLVGLTLTRRTGPADAAA
ncbi:MFS transporter [Streptomyces sp. NBC_01257]|uniref:MFS transporter n=1 Tax=Streptomyces sp. NBC_01257 TaxID=2903799 RepID=UPI002DD7FD37|nr:MFS transporter [Streptomyces sp. NBC_01257]WRZ67185.1 MFS transporter [Streptomyces sp. NBC_01257]